MVTEKDRLQYRNVLSRKYQFHYNDFEQNVSHFMNDIEALGVTINGPLFYSLHNVPMNEIMNVEIFIPIEEHSVIPPQDMTFHSYFSIDNMITTVDLANEEASTEVAYAKLIHYMEQRQLSQATPIFHVVAGDHSLQYVLIKIGVIEKEVEEAWK
ncbi:DUF5085 family protein [Bacillus sp. BGMRC 2118]|nr:DUF5085 family protein [Bacillus sp. BGMRC 2118]